MRCTLTGHRVLMGVVRHDALSSPLLLGNGNGNVSTPPFAARGLPQNHMSVTSFTFTPCLGCVSSARQPASPPELTADQRDHGCSALSGGSSLCITAGSVMYGMGAGGELMLDEVALLSDFWRVRPLGNPPTPLLAHLYSSFQRTAHGR